MIKRQEREQRSSMLSRNAFADMCGYGRTHSYVLQKLPGCPQPVDFGGSQRWFKDEVLAWLKSLPRSTPPAVLDPDDASVSDKRNHEHNLRTTTNDILEHFASKEEPSRPHWRNGRHLTGDVPLMIRKPLGLDRMATWSDAIEAVESRLKGKPEVGVAKSNDAMWAEDGARRRAALKRG